jgi:hypothetical protein
MCGTKVSKLPAYTTLDTVHCTRYIHIGLYDVSVVDFTAVAR